MWLLYEIIEKVRVNSVSKICELVTNVKTKHLGFIGWEEQNTAFEKQIL